MNITGFRLASGPGMQRPPGAHHQHHLVLACLPQFPAARHEHHWVSACFGAGHASGRACRSFPSRVMNITGFRLASGPGMQRPPGAHHEHHLALACLGTELAAASARIMNIIWPWLASGPSLPQLPGAHHEQHWVSACLGPACNGHQERIMSIIWPWLACRSFPARIMNITGFRLAGPGMQRPPGAHHQHHLALACLGAELAAASRRASRASFGFGLPHATATGLTS